MCLMDIADRLFVFSFHVEAYVPTNRTWLRLKIMRVRDHL